MAARVASQAAGGEIVVSDDVRMALDEYDEFALTPFEAVELKGLSGFHELWSVQGLEMQCIPTPVVSGDRLIAAGGRNSRVLAIRLADGRGELTKTQIAWTARNSTNIPSPQSSWYASSQSRPILVNADRIAS